MCVCVYTRGTKNKPEFIYKIYIYIYSYMFKLQSSSKYFPFDTMHLSRCFFHSSKEFLNSSILMPFCASAVFCFTSSTSAKLFLLRTFFIRGNNKKVSQGESRWLGRGGYEGHSIFGLKLLSIQLGVGRWAHKSPIMKWANALKESSKKKFHWSLMQPLTQCQLAHWYRWGPRTLT